ncbi:MAG TPA: NUDIX hydrolase, partial [Mucilaginibacter sp.]|nr:NUDIX hydrolase [Mucilaginibacter sp.]
MEGLQEIQDFFHKGYLEYRPNIVVDCAIFGYHNSELQLLLVKNKVFTKWCLPGGYVLRTENLAQAAARITADRTGIENLFLKQFKAFSEPNRNHPHSVDQEKFYELTGIKIDGNNW